MRKYSIREEIKTQSRCLRATTDRIWYGGSGVAGGWYNAKADYLHAECFHINTRFKNVVWTALWEAAERAKNE